MAALVPVGGAPVSAYLEIVCDVCANTWPGDGAGVRELRRRAKAAGWGRYHVGRRLKDTCNGLYGSAHTPELHRAEIIRQREAAQ